MRADTAELRRAVPAFRDRQYGNFTILVVGRPRCWRPDPASVGRLVCWPVIGGSPTIVCSQFRWLVSDRCCSLAAVGSGWPLLVQVPTPASSSLVVHGSLEEAAHATDSGLTGPRLGPARIRRHRSWSSAGDGRWSCALVLLRRPRSGGPDSLPTGSVVGRRGWAEVHPCRRHLIPRPIPHSNLTAQSAVTSSHGPPVGAARGGGVPTTGTCCRGPRGPARFIGPIHSHHAAPADSAPGIAHGAADRGIGPGTG